MTRTLVLALSIFALVGCQTTAEETNTPVSSSSDYQDLVALFHEWRAFENPPKLDGAPDYTAETFELRWPDFEQLRANLGGIDKSDWSVEQQVDWYIVWAEMNGYDFNHNILKPWVRDPAYYKAIWMDRSDVPAHEGPTNHGITELWTYSFPLTSEAKSKLINDLEVIPTLNNQAQKNLTGNAKELWNAGIRDIRNQVSDLKSIFELEGVKEDEELSAAINAAVASTEEFTAWLGDQGKSKTGPSGIGKENYTWYMQNVHLVPMTWEDEVMLLKTELASAWTSLKLEEHRNRNLPKLISAESPEAYDELAERSAKNFMSFLNDQEIVTVKDYFEPALREHLGSFSPKATRNFFAITMHYDQRPLYSHFYHWFELARMDIEPHQSEIRREPLLYNIWDSRNEGMATAVEEMFMDAGMYDDNPRVRELVYILIAQRAARGLGSLYAHANEMTMQEAGGVHSNNTPRGWMKTEPELLIFEQHLYLRQPGYGSSYITGKHLIKNALADYARIQEAAGQEFEIRDFYDQMNSIGSIPVSLGHWQLTGINEGIKGIEK